MKFWQVDAFTDSLFKGNPAAVLYSDKPFETDFMQKVAMEMNMSETAFVELRKGLNPLLRWFTPVSEIDLCGHATLSAAHIYFTEIAPDAESIIFETLFAGPLMVRRGEGAYVMDFPVRAGDPIVLDHIPSCVIEGVGGIMPQAAFKARDLMLVYPKAEDVISMKPNFNALSRYDGFVIVTAPSDDLRYDFISRFFCAGDGIEEDPVTGSAHCTLAPYWSKRLGKDVMRAYQASARGGEIDMHIKGERLDISGQALTAVSGILHLT